MPTTTQAVRADLSAQFLGEMNPLGCIGPRILPFIRVVNRAGTFDVCGPAVGHNPTGTGLQEGRKGGTAIKVNYLEKVQRTYSLVDSLVRYGITFEDEASTFSSQAELDQAGSRVAFNKYNTTHEQKVFKLITDKCTPGGIAAAAKIAKGTIRKTIAKAIAKVRPYGMVEVGMSYSAYLALAFSTELETLLDSQAIAGGSPVTLQADTVALGAALSKLLKVARVTIIPDDVCGEDYLSSIFVYGCRVDEIERLGISILKEKPCAGATPYIESVISAEEGKPTATAPLVIGTIADETMRENYFDAKGYRGFLDANIDKAVVQLFVDLADGAYEDETVTAVVQAAPAS